MDDTELLEKPADAEQETSLPAAEESAPTEPSGNEPDAVTSEKVSSYVSEYIEEYTSEAVTETERIIAETAEENQRLDSLFKPRAQETAPQKEEKKLYTVGIASAAASLIYIGAVLLAALLSPVEAFKAIYFAPAILIFIGAELAFAAIRRRSHRIEFDIKSVIISASLILITFVLSAIAKSVTPADVQRTHAMGRIKHIISRDISEVLSCDYIRNVDAEVTLYADDPTVYSLPSDLIVGDTVDITVYFSDAKMSVREFAADCRKTLDELSTLGYSFGEVKFINDDSVNRYTITVDWLYQQNYDELRLAEQAAYFGDNISETDIADISDNEDEDDNEK